MTDDTFIRRVGVEFTRLSLWHRPGDVIESTRVRN